MKCTRSTVEEESRAAPIPVILQDVRLSRTPPEQFLSSQHGMIDDVDASATSTDLVFSPSPLYSPHGRIVYLDTIIIELLGGARIASKPYSAASGHHILLAQGDRVWKVTRSTRENAFYLAVADGVAEVAKRVSTSQGTSRPPTVSAATPAAYNDEAARQRAAVLLEPFVPHSYGTRRVRRLRVGSYELGEEVILSKEDLKRLLDATRVMKARSEATESNRGEEEDRRLDASSTASRSSTPIVAVATFSPVSDSAVAHSFQTVPREADHSLTTVDEAGVSHVHEHLAYRSCPLIAERPQVLQSIVEQFDRDMEDVWMRYYRYAPPAMPAPEASPPSGVAHSVGSPLTKAALAIQRHAPEPCGETSGKKSPAASHLSEACCGTPSPTPLAFSVVLSAASGPPATEPHIAMEHQLNGHLPASGPPERSYVEMIVLEDCCHALQFPCTMDIKMGTRQYGLNASEEKMQSKIKKAKVSTTGRYGIRIDGVRWWNLSTKVCDTQDKKYYRRFSIEQVREAVHGFLTPHDASLARAMRAKIRAQCVALLRVFEEQTVYHFYTSSLLFLYDAMRPLETCKIVMVDFAYVYQTHELVEAEGEAALPEGGHDTSYITGLRSLIEVLKDDEDGASSSTRIDVREEKGSEK